MAGTRKLRGDLLRPLKPELEIKNRKYDDVVLRRRARFHPLRIRFLGFVAGDGVRDEVPYIGEMNIEALQRSARLANSRKWSSHCGHLAAPPFAHPSGIGLPDQQHHVPGALGTDGFQ